jgi:hypothetical protein
VIVPVLIAGGLVLGLVIGRWWALLGAVAVAAYVAVISEVEVSRWVLAFGYGAIAAASVAAGVLLRRLALRVLGSS